MHISPLLLALSTLPLPSLAAFICYFPNGETSKDVPCSPDLPITQCCGTRDACLSNGLCALTATNNTGTAYARGTCTDKSWASPLCPQQCQLNQDTSTNTSAYDFRASGVQVWQCGSEGYARDARFCCESEAESKRCCSTETAVFTLKAAVVGPSTSVSATSSSLRPSSSAASAAQSVASGSAAATSTTITVPVKQKSNKAVGIGAGIGGAVLVCVLVALVVFCVRKRKKERGLRETENVMSNKEEVVEVESKSPVELLTMERRAELPPNPQPVWELPGHGVGRSPRI